MASDCRILTPALEKSLSAYAGSASPSYVAMTDWYPAIGIDTAKFLSRQKGCTGTFVGHLAVQTAAVRIDNPGAWTSGWDTSRTGDGDWCSGEEPMTTYAGPAQWIRWGYRYDAGGAAFGQGDVTVQASFRQCGQVVASRTFTGTVDSTTGTVVEPLSEWMPCENIASFKAAIVMAGATTGMDCRIVYQTAATLTDNPGSWTATSDAYDTASERNTGTVAITLNAAGSNFWVRFGLECRSSTSAPGQATFTVLFGVRG